MITFERLGVRDDGNPVIETSTYIPADPNHPLAVELEGHEGFWVRIAVGNSFNHVRAKEVSRAEYNAHVAEIHDLNESRRLDAEEARERAKAELDAKKNEVRAELAKLGLSPQTITAILDQVRTG